MHVIRAQFTDHSGTYPHEFIYGTDPTVFADADAASARCAALNECAALLDWGDCGLPRYAVETLEISDLWPVELEQLAEANGWVDPGCTSPLGHAWDGGRCAWCGAEREPTVFEERWLGPGRTGIKTV